MCTLMHTWLWSYTHLHKHIGVGSKGMITAGAGTPLAFSYCCIIIGM